MVDDLAVRRASRPNGALLNEEESRAVNGDSTGEGTGHKTKDGKEKPPPLWRWFSAQHAHSIPERAAAALHCRDRWNLAYMRFSAIDRALAKEDSEYLNGFRELMDEYRLIFGIEDGDDDFARQTGVGGKMLPVSVEKCERCKREALPGTGLCARHGGQWISEKDMADMSRLLRERALTMSMGALRVLQDLMDNAKSEQVRSQTAIAILDRVGLGAHVNVNHSGNVTIESSDEAMDAIQSRLDQLAFNIQQKAELEARIDQSTALDGLGDIVDAELVPEPVERAQ